MARKSLARKTKEPRHTLTQQWNIIEDGTITGCSPHTITTDTSLRKNRIIRKNDLAIETNPKQTSRSGWNARPCLISVVPTHK